MGILPPSTTRSIQKIVFVARDDNALDAAVAASAAGKIGMPLLPNHHEERSRLAAGFIRGDGTQLLRLGGLFYEERMGVRPCEEGAEPSRTRQDAPDRSTSTAEQDRPAGDATPGDRLQVLAESARPFSSCLWCVVPRARGLYRNARGRSRTSPGKARLKMAARSDASATGHPRAGRGFTKADLGARAPSGSPRCTPTSRAEREVASTPSRYERHRTMKALVTGAAGFIGSHLVDGLIDLGHEVVGIDSFDDYYKRSTKMVNIESVGQHPRFEFVEGSLDDLTVDALLENVEVIFHLAGQPGVSTSWGSGFTSCLMNNVDSTNILLEAARERHIRRFVYASSSSVYATPKCVEPQSPYGVTKLAGEHLCSLYEQRYGLPTVALRYFSIYGPRQRPDMLFARAMMCASNRQPLLIYGNGRQSRDFTYVLDLVQATIRAGSSEELSSSVIDVGSGSAVSVLDALDMLRRTCGVHLDLQFDADGTSGPHESIADTSAAMSDLGWRSSTSMAEGLQRQYEDHLAWRTYSGPSGGSSWIA